MPLPYFSSLDRYRVASPLLFFDDFKLFVAVCLSKELGKDDKAKLLINLLKCLKVVFTTKIDSLKSKCRLGGADG